MTSPSGSPRTTSRSNLPSLSRRSTRERVFSLRSPSAPPLPTKISQSHIMSQGSSTPLPTRAHNPSAMSTAVPSPTSSVIDLEINHGVIIRDAEIDDPDVAEDEEQVGGVFTGSPEGSEERKKTLREQLRKTLSSKDINSDPSQHPRIRVPEPSTVDEAIKILEEQFPQRQYFIFTDAGKPVFVSRPKDAVEDIVSITGITSALISVFADESISADTPKQDRLRCIQAGLFRITFYLKSPLYYTVISNWGEPESVARQHLEFLHLQVLSILTASQLRRIFERRSNFDLRRLLDGTEPFIHTMISRLQNSIALQITLSALSVVRMEPMARSRIGDYLVPSRAASLDILYILLISDNDLITIVRPKRHSIHPSDLQILINAVHTSSVAANSASWLPICLPKFNPQGFVHAYVHFIGTDDSSTDHLHLRNIGKQLSDTDTRHKTPASETSSQLSAHGDTDIVQASTAASNDITDVVNGKSHKPLLPNEGGLVLITVCGGGEFDGVRNWSESIVKRLETNGIIVQLQKAIQDNPYQCSNLGIPGLRHFIYKSRVHVQITYPAWEDHYQVEDNRCRLITLYQKVHDAIHARSGQGGSLKLQYVRTNKEAVLGWVTQPFELYIALSPMIPKNAAVAAANAVARWVRQEEGRLFLRDAAVF